VSTYANKALIRRHFDEIWNQGQLAVADEIVAPAYVSHFPLPGQPPGIAGFKYAVQVLRTSFPDLHITIEDLISEGDKVVARLVAHGTHHATFRGIAPTGREVRWAGIRIFRIEEGKIAEHWANWDDLGLMQQLGAAPLSHSSL
jgi:steroid delta-isomerase-like uncharacterized protein